MMSVFLITSGFFHFPGRNLFLPGRNLFLPGRFLPFFFRVFFHQWKKPANPVAGSLDFVSWLSVPCPYIIGDQSHLYNTFKVFDLI